MRNKKKYSFFRNRFRRIDTIFTFTKKNRTNLKSDLGICYCKLYTVKVSFLARDQARVDFFLIAFHYDHFGITIIEIRNVNLIVIIIISIKKDNFKDSFIFYYYYYYYIDSLFFPFFPFIFLILIDCRSLTIDRNRL